MNKDEFAKIAELAEPLKKYLRKNHDPYCEMVIGYDDVKITQTIIHIPKGEGTQNKVGQEVREEWKETS